MATGCHRLVARWSYSPSERFSGKSCDRIWRFFKEDLLIHPMVTLDQGQGPAILQDHSSGEGPRGSWVTASSELLIFLRSWFEFKILADRDVTDVHSWSMAWTMQRLLICGKFNHEYWNSYSKKHVQNRLMAEPVQRKSDSFFLGREKNEQPQIHCLTPWRTMSNGSTRGIRHSRLPVGIVILHLHCQLCTQKAKCVACQRWDVKLNMVSFIMANGMVGLSVGANSLVVESMSGMQDALSCSL